MCCLGQRFVICSFCFRAVKRQFTNEKNENLWQLKTIKYITLIFVIALAKCYNLWVLIAWLTIQGDSSFTTRSKTATSNRFKILKKFKNRIFWKSFNFFNVTGKYFILIQYPYINLHNFSLRVLSNIYKKFGVI
jgi:hypothetical protein